MTNKSDADFAAMLDRFHSGGYVTAPAPLVVNEVGQITAEHARQIVQVYRAQYPEMQQAASRLFRHDTAPPLIVIIDESHLLKETATRWGDAMADPLTDLKRMRDAVFAASVATKKFTVSLRIAKKIARRTMSKRAYRRWRGRNR